jgi:hypothetical protein
MDLLHVVTEAEVVAAFLRAELGSPRYGAPIRELMTSDATLVTEPRLDDERENAERAELLDRHRSWLRREGLFDGLPREIEWFVASTPRPELLEILYIDWGWWVEITGGTRRPLDAARRIRAGRVPGSDIGEEEGVALALAPPGRVPAPRLIALAPPDLRRVVLLEGHARLTSYALFPEHVPDRVEILLGLSERIADWSLF